MIRRLTKTKTYEPPSVKRERERRLKEASPAYAAAVRSIDTYLIG